MIVIMAGATGIAEYAHLSRTLDIITGMLINYYSTNLYHVQS